MFELELLKEERKMTVMNVTIEIPKLPFLVYREMIAFKEKKGKVKRKWSCKLKVKYMIYITNLIFFRQYYYLFFLYFC